jgi:hypothetical protein
MGATLRNPVYKKDDERGSLDWTEAAMKKKLGKKLVLAATRVRNLGTEELHRVAGGASGLDTCNCASDDCTQAYTCPCEPTIKRPTLISCNNCSGRVC